MGQFLANRAKEADALKKMMDAETDPALKKDLKARYDEAATWGQTVTTMRPKFLTNAPISGRMTIDGVLVEYQVTLLPSGTANVGTIFQVK